MSEPAAQTHRFPVLPLKNAVLFPLQIMPLTIGRAGSVAAVQAALETEDKTLLVVTQQAPQTDEPGFADLFQVGTIAVIKRMQRSTEALHVIVQGGSRARLVALVSDAPFLQVDAAMLLEPHDTSTQIEALQAEVVKLAQHAFQFLQAPSHAPLAELLQQIETPIQQVYFLASIFSLGMEREQAILAAETQEAGLRNMHEYLSHEVQVLELRSQIAEQAQGEMSRQQREYFLRQQLEAIRNELGEQSAEQAEAAELRRRVDEAAFYPPHGRAEPVADAGRSRQAGARFPRRSCLGLDGDPGPGSERRVS